MLQNSPPEYRYSIYHAIDSFWLAFNNRDLDAAKQQMKEAKNRGASNFILAELKAILFFSNSQYDKAADMFNQAVALRPSTVLLYNLAFTYWRMGELVMSENTLNDLFKVELPYGIGNCVDITVFNRWGMKVYDSHGQNSGWDGRTTAGEKVPEGTYFYIIEINGITKKGSLTLKD